MNALLFSKMLGQLTIARTFVYFDGPRLFSCRSATGQAYLAVFADEGENHEDWLYVALSEDRYSALLKNDIDLHDAFRNSETGRVHHLRLFPSENRTEEACLLSIEIDDSMLPAKGALLDADPLAESEWDQGIEGSRKLTLNLKALIAQGTYNPHEDTALPVAA